MMTNKTRAVGVFAILLVGGAFLAGYWPEHQQRLAVEREHAAMHARVTGLDDQVRAARLHGEMLNLIDMIEAMNFGQAQAQSSALYDQIRAEAARTSDPSLRAVFGESLADRDVVTGALAKGDAGALAPLKGAERKLRELVGRLSPVGV